MASAPRVPLFGLLDLVLLAGFGAGYLATALVPGRWDERVVRFVGSLAVFVSPGRVRQLGLRMAKALPLPAGRQDSMQLGRDHVRLCVELWWGRFRGLRRRGWRPVLELEGVEHLRRGLEAGRGVLLWRMNFCGNPAFLQGLATHGICVVHLSNEHHGAPSCSRLGLRWTAPLYRRAEEEYMAARIVIPLDQSLGYIRELLDLLRQNAVVSIVGENRGRSNVTIPILGSEVEIATGAPALAHKSGAALLTAHIERTGFFRFRVVIHEPIEAERTLGRKEFVQRAANEFARRLEVCLAKRPADWMGWLRPRYPVVMDG